MQMRPALRSAIRPALHGVFLHVVYHTGALLNFDADLDPYSEQTGGVHTFNHAVLSPQYQRNADGAYANVGAKPAVDTFDGKKWLRSCGAVANLLPSGAENFASGRTALDVEGATGAKRFVPTTASSQHRADIAPVSALGPHFLSVELKADGYDYASLRIGSTGYGFDLSLCALGFAGAAVATILPLSDGWCRCSVYVADAAANSVCRINVESTNTIAGSFYGDGTSGILVRNPILTATAYPVPYVPPGVTQPASGATTTNGVWFANPDGSPLWQALTGTAMTAGFRVRLVFSSADIPNSSVLNLATPDDVAGRFLTIQKSAGGALTAVLSDGTNSATVTLAAWNRGDVLHFFPQVAAGATQMRIGYKTDSATSITWGSLATFAGTFGPDSTLDRFMLGYNNAYPFGVNKLTVVTGAKADAEILGWWK